MRADADRMLEGLETRIIKRLDDKDRDSERDVADFEARLRELEKAAVELKTTNRMIAAFGGLALSLIALGMTAIGLFK